MVRYFIEALAALGPPQAGIAVDDRSASRSAPPPRPP